VVHVPAFEQPAVLAALRAAFPARDVVAWDAAPGDAREEAEVLVCFRPPEAAFAKLTRLRLVHSSGAGVDLILRAPGLPDVPVMRVRDDRPARTMARHVVHAVLHLLGRHDDYAAQQREGTWRRLPPVGELPVGVLGLGDMGIAAARALAGLGLPVTGWSRTPRDIPGIACRAGMAELDAVLEAARILVVLLPLTPETRGLLDARRLALLPRGAALVAAGRGGQVVEADLIAALDSGHLAAAHLDVFEAEPLPTGHPLWAHPRVTITPHIASPPDAEALARSVVAALAALDRGEMPAGAADRSRGY
jgi:glyoxylate/hydroxypyruvate reductase A